MSIPFSNTNLRIPRGFGNILEGLAREVLRNQPDDIPAFAALYFNALLKEREESGTDPAEWGAKLEDRFYNNHAFQEIEKDASAGAEQEPAPAEPLNESSTPEPLGIIESEIIRPVHIKTVATANFDVFADPGR
ncbi:sperm surface protein Sp17-like [Megalops cyprinoides]|uniref:sperm surface protein Sp17-like n=1 Tax=Megalops cyprinoides TaxID=118141 RepID=UPI001864C7ED|nr:sperm surface protein Sp17-like [Megalops cyprinoides]